MGGRWGREWGREVREVGKGDGGKVGEGVG